MLLATISRNRAIQIDSWTQKGKAGRSERRTLGLMNEREPIGRHATQTLFRYSFNDVTRARILLQMREENRGERGIQNPLWNYLSDKIHCLSKFQLDTILFFL